MPATRTSGMDHPHYPFSPLPQRPRLTWPGGAHLALAPIICLQYLDLPNTADAEVHRGLAGGLGPRPHPNYPLLSHREYGHRVGVFRVIDALQKSGLPVTVAIDVRTAEGYPRLVERLRDSGATFVAHGMAAGNVITSDMPKAEERNHIASVAERLTAALGTPVIGWLSPEQSESEHTPQLLAEAGFTYVCDWVNDEQPYHMTVPQGTLLAMPLMLEYDDVWALWYRGVTPADWAEMVTVGGALLAREGRESARLMAFRLHPWLIGQPFRIGYLEDALAQLADLPGVWPTTLDEIARVFPERSNP